MISMGDDGFIANLIKQVEELFGAKRRYKVPATVPQGQPPATPSQNVISSPGGFQAPIHGTWHNVGGFDLGAKRADGSTGHAGLDMSCPAGTPVYALGRGVVNKVGIDGYGGNIVGVQHGKDLWSYYAHLSTAKVYEGDKVDQNTIVGTAGNTGNAGNPKNPLMTQEGGRTWPHLHFGVKEHGTWINPSKFFTVPPYEPDFAKNPAKYQKFWLSDRAKQEAQSFEMKKYLAAQHAKSAFSRDVDRLLKLSHQYSKLAR